LSANDALEDLFIIIIDWQGLINT